MTVAVIGHGRSPEGCGWGSKIDACMAVVRMWDWYPWQRSRDYGERYNYGLFVLTPRGLATFNLHNVMTPSRGWLAYMGKPTDGVLPDGAPVHMLNLERWTEMGRALGGAGLNGKLTLTRGCAAAAWAIETAQNHSKDGKVVLVGYDNLRLQTNRPVEESFCPEYWRQYNDRYRQAASDMDKVYPTDGPRTATHDMTIELPLLRQLAKTNKVDLQFAQEVW